MSDRLDILNEAADLVLRFARDEKRLRKLVEEAYKEGARHGITGRLDDAPLDEREMRHVLTGWSCSLAKIKLEEM